MHIEINPQNYRISSFGADYLPDPSGAPIVEYGHKGWLNVDFVMYNGEFLRQPAWVAGYPWQPKWKNVTCSTQTPIVRIPG